MLEGERQGLFHWDEIETEEQERIIDAVYLIGFGATAIVSLYLLNVASIEPIGLISGLFAFQIGLEEIKQLLIRLVPFLFLFPMTMALIAVYGMEKRPHYLALAFTSLVVLGAGLFFFEPDLTYVLFGIGFLTGTLLCGRKAHRRYQKSQRPSVYMASTEGASTAYLLMKAGVVASIFLLMYSNAGIVDNMMEQATDAYAEIALEINKKQIDKQVEAGFSAQKKAQISILSNHTAYVMENMKLLGKQRINIIEQKQKARIENILAGREKDQVEGSIQEVIENQKREWGEDVDEKEQEIKEGIREGLENKSQRKQMLAEYKKRYRQEYLTKEKMKQQTQSILKQPITVNDREIVIGEVVQDVLPFFTALLLWGIMGLWKNLMFNPLVGIYSNIIKKITTL